MAHSSESPTSPRRVSAKAKAQRALELRKGSMTYERIAAVPTDRNHPEGTDGYKPLYADKSAARKAVQRELAAREAQTDETAHEVRALELARLDEMQASMWVPALNKDPKAIEVILKLMDRRTRYIGIDYADGLDERYLQIQEDTAHRSLAAMEQAMADVGLSPETVGEVLGRVVHHLDAPGSTQPSGSSEA